MNDMFENIRIKREKAEQELQYLVENNNSEALLTCMISQLLLVSPDQGLGDSFGNHPAMLETLANQCIPKFGDNTTLPVSPFLTNHCYGLLEKIVRGKLITSSFLDKNEKALGIVSRLAMHSEIVRGSAYPEQTYNKIKTIQGNFDKWFEKKIGISPGRTVDLVLALIRRAESIATNNLTLYREAGEAWQSHYNGIFVKKTKTKEEQDFLNMFPTGKDADIAAFCFGYAAVQNELMSNELPAELESLAISPSLTESEIVAFKKLFCVNKDSIADVKHIQRKTFYELTSGKVIFSEISNCFDVIWDEFENIAKTDSKFYSSRYQKKKANWLEERVYAHLATIFPKECIYSNLTYPDPTKDDGTAELDLAVKWGPFLLIVEAKAKQFRFESISGDSGRLRTDIKSNVQDAYNQSLRAIQYINQNEACKFTEIETNRELVFKSDSLPRIFPVSVSFHHLAGVATQLDELKDLGLFLENKYPFSICESDLELLTYANFSPDSFLHYISRRLSVLEDISQWHGDEVDMFMAYLDCRLLLCNISSDGKGRPNSLFITGHSEKMDQLMAFNRGEYPDKPEIKLQLPSGVEPIFEQLKSWDDNGARWISFSLLELENETLYNISQVIYELKHTDIPHNGFRRTTFHHEDTVISIIGSSTASFEQLKERMTFRGLSEKYRRKAKKSIVFGVLCNGDNMIFDIADYIEFDWQKNVEMENILSEEPDFVPLYIPGRNEQCFCGSGQKYKKCCLRKVERARKIHPQLLQDR